MNDTDLLPSTIKHAAAFLRSPAAGFDGVLHWDWLKRGVNFRGISPMDIDASVETHNFFLMVESKDEGVNISTGQRMAIDALVKTGLVTFVYQYGKEVPTAWQIHQWNGKSELIKTAKEGSTMLLDMEAFARKWFVHHDGLRNDAWQHRLIEVACKDSSPAERCAMIAFIEGIS
jgi:hypothetical protein